MTGGGEAPPAQRASAKREPPVLGWRGRIDALMRSILRTRPARAILDVVSAHAEPWIAARDQAALTLIWGSGLRISEALGLKQRQAPLGDVVRVTGKGGKEREVPVLPVASEAVEAAMAGVEV